MPVIEIADLTKRYRNGTLANDGPSFALGPAQRTRPETQWPSTMGGPLGCSDGRAPKASLLRPHRRR